MLCIYLWKSVIAAFIITDIIYIYQDIISENCERICMTGWKFVGLSKSMPKSDDDNDNDDVDNNNNNNNNNQCHWIGM
jgi:hypothetical protein